jgi:hypothetical protein
MLIKGNDKELLTAFEMHSDRSVCIGIDGSYVDVNNLGEALKKQASGIIESAFEGSDWEREEEAWAREQIKENKVQELRDDLPRHPDLFFKGSSPIGPFVDPEIEVADEEVWEWVSDSKSRCQQDMWEELESAGDNYDRALEALLLSWDKIDFSDWHCPECDTDHPVAGYLLMCDHCNEVICMTSVDANLECPDCEHPISVLELLAMEALKNVKNHNDGEREPAPQPGPGA